MFGPRGAEQLGIYRHHHNHRHDLQGRIVLPRRKKLLLAPRMLPGSYPKPLLSVIRCLLHLLGVRTENNERIISDEDLPYYFAVSDVVFIQRCVILNSGVVPMAFLFGRGVVGPDSGVVGRIFISITGSRLLWNSFRPVRSAGYWSVEIIAA